MWEMVRANQRHAATLVVVMAALLLAVGYAVGEAVAGAGTGGLLIAFAIWVVLSLVSYYSGDQIFLSLAGAHQIGKQDNPVLYNIVEEMCLAAGLAKMPAIYVIDDAAPNAFATGRDAEHASVAVTAGLLETLSRDELQGVIAHELGHVKNRDVLYMMMVGVMMGAIVLLADLGTRVLFYGGGGRRRTSSRDGGQAQVIILIVAVVLMILAPLIAQLIYFAVSRRREYLADACSALYTRYPEGLANALEKISRSTVALHSASRATAPLYIVNPLGASAKGLADITSTHPPTSERIRILRSMGGGAGYGQYDEAFRKVTGKPVGVIPAGSLRAAEHAPTSAPKAPDTRERLERVRHTTDMLWRLNQYVFIACACGTTLKVPPAYLGKEIACPHCGAKHVVTATAPTSAQAAAS